MASTSQEASPVAIELSRLVGGFGQAEDWVSEVLRLFPLPAPGDAWALFSAQQRIVRSVPWIGPALGQKDLDHLLDEILERLARVGVIDRREARTRLRGDFSLAGTLVGHEQVPMPGPENLRAALWLCHARWVAEGKPRTSAVSDLAAAIRGAVLIRDESSTRSPSIAKHLGPLGMATNLAEFVEVSQVLLTCEHVTAQRVWRAHVEPELRRVLRGPVAGKPSRPAPVIRPPDDGGPPTALDGRDELDFLAGQIRNVPRLPLVGPLPLAEGEPIDEIAVMEAVCPLPAHAENEDARRMAIWQAGQVVWCQNSYLLTNHLDVLPATELRRVVKILAGVLQDDSAEPGMLFGSGILLLQAVTGRTNNAVSSIQFVNDLDMSSPDSACQICLEKSVISLPVFWKVRQDREETESLPSATSQTASARSGTGFFVPTKEQLPLLEPVAERFNLPLPMEISDAIKQSGLFPQYATVERSLRDRWIRHAAKNVSLKLGIPVTAGQIRRSFSAHLFETCRDTAVTQLICADTLGQSAAPLHYYAPKAAEVSAAYTAVLGVFLDVKQEPPVAHSGTGRVGSSLLLRPRCARDLTKALEDPLKPGVSKLLAEGDYGRVHRALVCHLACMLMSAAGHREANALFSLSLDELDVEFGSGLFNDKVHDPAHDPRLVVLPRCVIRQVIAYVQHLHGLAQLRPQFASHIRKVLDGKKPLLFNPTEEDQEKPLTIGLLKTWLPTSWRVLPLNWGRTWIRTRMIEMGLSPEMASMQLGHLEAVGYPFSNGSPTEPEAFVAKVQPVLDMVADRQGWSVRQGIPFNGKTNKTPLPLKFWSAEVKKHEAQARTHAEEWRLARRASMKSYRRQAEKDVLEHPAIMEAGIPGVLSNHEGPWLKRTISRNAAEAVRDELFESAGDDTSLGLARADALHRLLKRANKRMGVSGQEPSRLSTFRRPVDNAFVPKMMSAVKQVRALRKAALSRATDGPGNWRDFSLACARTVHALVLFGRCEDPDQIEGVLKHRDEALRLSSLDDVVLVPWGSEPHQVTATRGLAALAVAKLAKKYPNQTVPSRESINKSLASFLPDWALSQRHRVLMAAPADGESKSSNRKALDILRMLCDTVSVCNRLELSPAARLALDPSTGSINAHPEEQAALLDSAPCGTLTREWEAPTSENGGVGSRRFETSKGNARSQYLALCRVLPHEGKDLKLPLTGRVIDASRLFTPETRTLVIEEIKAVLKEQGPERLLQPVVEMLATWVLEMLVEGTEATSVPADVTVRTYLNRIGGGLVAVLGNASLLGLDDSYLENVYLAVVEAHNTDCDKAAKAVVSFHDCCMRRFGLPELDLTEVHYYLSTSHRCVDARLILPCEREGAIKSLVELASKSSATKKAERAIVRVHRQAAAAMPLYAHGGARRSEVLGVKFADVLIRDDAPWVRIRSNPSRQLKTPAARRILHLNPDINPASTEYFIEWHGAERDRLHHWRHEGAFVFAGLDNARSAHGRQHIAEACIGALARTSGRKSERLHRLRHLIAYERLTPLVLSDQDRSRLTIIDTESVPRVGGGDIILPRDLMGRVVILGHKHFVTSVRCYHHLPWLFRSRPDAALGSKYVNRRGAAIVMGLTLAAVDRITQAQKDTPCGRAWLDHLIMPREVPSHAETAPEEVDPAQSMSWTATEVGRLLEHVERTGSMERALLVMGADVDEADRFRNLFSIYEQRLGLLLVGDGRNRGAPKKRVVRRLDEARCLESIWHWYDANIDGAAREIGDIVEACYDWMVPSDRDWVRADDHAIKQLTSLLVRAGVCSAQITTEPVGRGLSRVRIARADSKNVEQNDRYLGLAMKRVIGAVLVASRTQSSRP